MKDLSINENYKIEEQTISISDIPIYVGLLKGNKNFSYLLNIQVIDQGETVISQNRYKISYYLLNPNEYRVGVIHSYMDGLAVVPSIRTIFPRATSLEDEITFRKNIFFKARFLNEKNFFQTPAEIASEHTKKIYDIDGSFIGQFYLKESNLEYNPERSRAWRPYLGFFSRGMEKSFEFLNLKNLPFFAEKINPKVGIFYSITLLKMIEKDLSLNVSDKTKCIRMVICELSRINSHLLVLSRINYSIAINRISNELTVLCQQLYLKINKLSQANSISPTLNYGGFNHDLPEGWGGEILEFLTYLKSFLYKSHREMVKNIDWRNNFSNCSIDKNLAFELGLTGPNLRASGINWDIREKSKDYFYQDIEFEVPIGKNGTSYDRYLVRLEEIYQSIHIIDQLLNNMPLEIMSLNSIEEENSREWGQEKINKFLAKSQKQQKLLDAINEINSLYFDEFPEGISGFALNKINTENSKFNLSFFNPHHNTLSVFCDYMEKNNLHQNFDLEFFSFGIEYLEVEK